MINVFAVTGQMETIERKTEKPKEIVVQEQLLLTLESAYPNILPTDDLAQSVLAAFEYFYFTCCCLSFN